MDFDERATRHQLPLAVNRATTRRVPLACRDLEVITAVELEHRLDESFAKRVRAEDERAIVVLQCTGNDLRRRCGPAVEQHDERNRIAEMTSRGTEHFRRLTARADGGDLLPVAEEQARGLEGLLDDAAAIV